MYAYVHACFKWAHLPPFLDHFYTFIIVISFFLESGWMDNVVAWHGPAGSTLWIQTSTNKHTLHTAKRKLKQYSLLYSSLRKVCMDNCIFEYTYCQCIETSLLAENNKSSPHSVGCFSFSRYNQSTTCRTVYFVLFTNSLLFRVIFF